MRRTTFGSVAALAVAVAGCGGGSHFANKPRPATPVDLTVYVNDARVSISPASVGAGQVIFLVTNQASSAESVVIHRQGQSGRRLASTGPINPQATAQVTVDLGNPGDYTVATAASGDELAVSTSPKIHPAKLHIGPARPHSNNALLQP